MNFVLRFFINVQIMNNRLFDVLKYIHAQSLEDQEILYEYLFESKFYHYLFINTK